MKVAIVGSREYTNKEKVKDLIFELKKRFGDELVIVSGEQAHGADKLAKMSALELNVTYHCFPPAHYQWNSFCVKPSFWYGKPFQNKNYYIRNSEIVKYSDMVVIFIPPETKIEDHHGSYSVYTLVKKDPNRYIIIS